MSIGVVKYIFHTVRIRAVPRGARLEAQSRLIMGPAGLSAAGRKTQRHRGRVSADHGPDEFVGSVPSVSLCFPALCRLIMWPANWGGSGTSSRAPRAGPGVTA
jgi:hypothetical protein